MLQWMGGSRKKVVTSRKSTHNRQKQYFEQRKRQRQAPGNENCADSNDKQVNCNAEPRSLDILNLINLAVASQKASTELTISPVDPHVSKFLDTTLLGKLPCSYSPVLKESGSEQLKNSSDSNLLGVSQPQDLTDSYICSSYVNRPKMPVSITEHTSSQLDGALNEKNEKPQNEVTVLDLLGDDGPYKVSNRKSIPEAHVAFSVEGLGKIGTRTPAHSPTLQNRSRTPAHSPTLQNRFFCKGLSLASKASRHASLSSTLESSHYELNEELNAMMDDFRVSPLCYKGGQLDDVGAKSPTCKSSVLLMSPDSREDFEKVSIKDSFGYLEKQLNEESSDAASHNQRFYMDYHSLKSNSKKHEKYTTSDFEVGDTFLPSSRNLWEGCKIFDASEMSTTPDFFNMERGHVTAGKEGSQSFTWESDVINADEMLDPVSWNFLPTEDSQDNASLSSEDSNSFNAVRNKNSLNFGAQSMKHGKNKKKKLKEKFQMNSGEMSFFENLYQDRNIFTSSNETVREKEKKCSSQFRTLGDENSFLPGQFFPPKAASAPDPFNSLHMGKSTRSSGHKALYQDDLFDLSLMPKYKFEIPSDFEPSSDFIYQSEMSRKRSPSDFHSKSATKYSSKLKGHVQHSSSGGGFCKNIHFTHLSKYQDDNEDRGSSGKPQPDDYEKRSTSSVNAESATGTDNLSKGNEHDESKGKLPEPSDTQKTEYSHDEAEVNPTVMEEVPSQLQNYVHGKLNQFQGGSPVPSHLSNEESKAACGPETETVQSDAGGNGDASYQVMLQSYVLQLLCVQKVLWEASGKDIKKKV